MRQSYHRKNNVTRYREAQRNIESNFQQSLYKSAQINVDHRPAKLNDKPGS